MTLEEKVGQMTQLTLAAVAGDQAAAAAGPTALDALGDAAAGAQRVRLDEQKLREALIDYNVGSLLNVVDHAQPLEHWQTLIRQSKDLAVEETRLGIPVIYGIDAVHGANYIVGATIFPHNVGRAAAFDRDLVRDAGAVTVFETRASGIPWNFAPVLDLGRQPVFSRFYETFGEDVLLASELGEAAVRGMEEDVIDGPDVVAASAKHHVGYSAPLSGKDRTTAHIPERILREYFLTPFAAAIDAGIRTVMVNSGDVNGIPVHASRYLLTDVLRGELGFEDVELEPGEAQRVAFTLGVDELAFVGPDDEWTVEPGTFRVEVGDLSETFEVVAQGTR